MGAGYWLIRQVMAKGYGAANGAIAKRGTPAL